MKVININLMGSLNMALYAAQEMVKRHTGVIISQSESTWGRMLTPLKEV